MRALKYVLVGLGVVAFAGAMLWKWFTVTVSLGDVSGLSSSLLTLLGGLLGGGGGIAGGAAGFDVGSVAGSPLAASGPLASMPAGFTVDESAPGLWAIGVLAALGLALVSRRVGDAAGRAGLGVTVATLAILAVYTVKTYRPDLGGGTSGLAADFSANLITRTVHWEPGLIVAAAAALLPLAAILIPETSRAPGASAAAPAHLSEAPTVPPPVVSVP